MELLKSFKKKTDNPDEVFIYSEEQLMARLKFFIGVCLALTLVGIVFVVLYSLIFVTQPMNAIAPIDQKFFELIIPIATFLTGTLSGIMLAGNDKDAQKDALKAANKGWDKPPTPPAPTPGLSGGFGSMGGSFGSSQPGFGAVPPMGAGSGFGSMSGGFGAPMAPMAPMMSSTGKPMPMMQDDPEI